MTDLLPNEIACLRVLKECGVSTWANVQVQARMPHMQRNVFLSGGYIINIGRKPDGSADMYALTEKGMKATETIGESNG